MSSIGWLFILDWAPHYGMKILPFSGHFCLRNNCRATRIVEIDLRPEGESEEMLIAVEFMI
jgi:hypothetical protein